MEQEIHAALRDLLMRYGRVSLHGIGTLTREPRPAVISLMEGRAQPPGASPRFNDNLVADDGRLRQAIGDHVDLDGYLRQVDADLQAGKTVTLDGIGRLRRAAGGSILLHAPATDLSRDNFGLPSLPVRPVTVGKTQKETAARRAAATPLVARPYAREKHRSVRPLYLLLGLVGIMLFGFLLIRFLTVFDEPEVAPAPVAAEKVRPDDPPRMRESTVPPPAPEREEVVATDPTPAHSALIAIGLYGRQRNVDKQVRRIEEAGYTPVTESLGRNTRVGVRYDYTEREKLDAALNDLRRRFTEDAFVMMVDGELRRLR